ncbi:MAG: transcription antitermination factor NusB [Clostridia bacterium]|nr:transcription antitermination factor NusB [Clostridia bacterium]
MSNNSNKKKYTEEEKNEYIRKMRELREQIFAIIFEMSFSEDSYEDILDNAVESRMIVAENYMIDVLKYYSENNEKVDEVIKANIKGWTIDRLSRTTLSVLRLAVSEINATKTGKSIVINEAVEITKKYATPKEAAFVNGVLGSIFNSKSK